MVDQKQYQCYHKYGLNIKDHKVKVGSGWTHEQRLTIY